MGKLFKGLGVGLLAVLLLGALNEFVVTKFCHIDDLEIRAVRDLRYLPPAGTRMNALILGDSTAAFDLNASALPGAASLALVNGSSVEAYFILRRYLEGHPGPRCVLLSLSFHGPERETVFWEQFVKNHFFRGIELEELYDASKRAGFFPASTYPYWLFRLKALLLEWRITGFSFAALQNGLLHFGAIRDAHERFLRKMEANSGPAAPGSSQDLEGDRTMDFPAPPVSDALQAEYFRSTLDLAHRTGAKVFLLPPLFPVSTAGDRVDAYQKSYRALVASLAAGRELELLPVSPLGDEAFVKTGHLGESAARKMTAGLRSRIAACFPAP